MRVFTLLLTLLVALPAAAQMGTGTCSGGLTGTVGIAFKDKSGNFQAVQAASVPYVFSGADCTCPNQDLFLDILLTKTLDTTATGAAQFWVGSGCGDPNNRNNPNLVVCEQINDSPVTFTEFVSGKTPSGGHIYVPIPTDALWAPKTHMCPSGNTTNGAFVLIFSGNMTSTTGMPFATCSIDTFQLSHGDAAAATGLNAAGGDGAATLNWSTPIGTNARNYQVLCADSAGNPVRSNAPAAIYSTCTQKGIERRELPTGGTTPGVGDGGVGTASEPLGTDSVPGGDYPAPLPEATADGGTSDGGTGTVSIGFPLPSPFTFLDTKFVCSGQIPSTSNTTRITGLKNSETYQFVVVAVDDYGNPTPTADVVKATPQPVEDLYRRFRDEGGGASGFCFIATAAYGSYENRWVRILRDFRDEVLLPTHAGTAFVAWYYANSPGPASWIAVHPTARFFTRLVLWPVIGFAAAWLYLPWWLNLALVLGAAAWLVRRRRRRLRAA